MNDCDRARAAVTARLNDVDPLWSGSEMTEHLDGCRACRDWEARELALHQRRKRQQRARQEEGVRSSRAPEGLRYLLGAIAATEIVLAGADLAGANLHPFRELAGTDLAFAIGCLIAAVQPRRSFGLVPVAVALAVLIVGTGVVDLVRGVTGPLAESRHVLEIAGAAALFALGRRMRAAGALPG